MREITFNEAIAEALVQTMQYNSNVFIMGEGVDDSKGIFGTTKSAYEKFPERVFDTPLSENALTGWGTGAALGGMRPVMVHARIDFLMLAMDQIINHAAKWNYMHGLSVPWTIRTIVGRGWGQGAQHSQALHPLFAHIPGLKVVAPSDAFSAKGLLISSILDDSPVIFIEHRWLEDKVSSVPEDFYDILKEAKCQIADFSKNVMSEPAFVESLTGAHPEEEYDLVLLTTAYLTREKGGTTAEVFAGAEEMGLKKCPAWMGPKLRSEYLDQPKGKRVLIGMEFIPTSDGTLALFSEERYDSELWLIASSRDSEKFWNPDDLWVFVYPRK